MNTALSWLYKILIAPVIKLLLIKEIKGLENVPKHNFILASNHQSHLDEFATGYICAPRKFHFIGQTDSHKGAEKLLTHLVYFTHGVIGVDRKSEESKRTAVQKAIKVLKEKDILIIYPEGTRTRTGQMGIGKKGAARIFLEADTCILPVAVEGTFDMLPPNGKLKIKKNIRINIGKPLYFKKERRKALKAEKDSLEYKKISEDITFKLMDKIANLRKDIL